MGGRERSRVVHRHAHSPLAICWDVGGDADGNVREGGRETWLTFVLFLKPLLPSIQMYLQVFLACRRRCLVGHETYSASTLPFWSSSGRVRYRGACRNRSGDAYSCTWRGCREEEEGQLRLSRRVKLESSSSWRARAVGVTYLAALLTMTLSAMMGGQRRWMDGEVEMDGWMDGWMDGVLRTVFIEERKQGKRVRWWNSASSLLFDAAASRPVGPLLKA
jgi:hypothetical protein